MYSSISAASQEVALQLAWRKLSLVRRSVIAGMECGGIRR